MKKRQKPKNRLTISLLGKIPPYKAYQMSRSGPYNPVGKVKNHYRQIIKSQLPKGWVPVDAPIFMDMIHKRIIPQYLKKEVKAGDYHKKTPDLTNLNKFVEDCLKELVFKDDNLVVRLFDNYKIYSEEPGVDVTIYW